MIHYTHISILLEKIIFCTYMFIFGTFFHGTVSMVASAYFPKDFMFGTIVSFHRVVTELCRWQATDSCGMEGDVSFSTMVNKGMYCPSFDIKYMRFWTIVIQRGTPALKCCNTTDGISAFSLWMFAVSTVVCCVHCCFLCPMLLLYPNIHITTFGFNSEYERWWWAWPPSASIQFLTQG
jgi:hypothetical protein